MTSTEPLVLQERRGDIAILTLNRPAQRNALSHQLARTLVAMIAELRTDTSIRALILTGAGERAFCAGADLVERRTLKPEERAGTTDTIFNACQSLAEFPAPVIAAIRGFCLAGGSEMAVSCDLRVASEDAVFGLTEVRVGIFPGAGATVRLPRLVGQGVARDLLYTGRRIDAAEALRIGLVERVVPNGTELAVAFAIAEEIAQNAPLAVRAVKAALRDSEALPEADAHAAVLRHRRPLDASEDYSEGLAAFAEKRAPRFTGR